MTHLMLVDASNFCMACHFAAEGLTSPSGVETGAVFATLRSTKSMIEKLGQVEGANTIKLMFAWDAPRASTWRRNLFEGYKADRDKKDDRKLKVYYDQLPYIKRALTSLGVTHLSAKSMEADDIASAVAAKVRATEGAVATLISNDKDWVQLVDKRVRVYQTSKSRLITDENFAEITGVATPQQYLQFLAIVGDPIDNIPGCKGVGEATALKFMKGELAPKTTRYESIHEWAFDPEGLPRSRVLLDLIDPAEKPARLDIESGSLNQDDLRSLCKELGFDSITAEFDSFVETFKKVAH